MSNGKGSKPRPRQVDRATYDRRFDLIFGRDHALDSIERAERAFDVMLASEDKAEREFEETMIQELEAWELCES